MGCPSRRAARRAAGASEKADTAGPFQLAQGRSKAAAPPSSPAPQAQAPAGEQGIEKQITELQQAVDITPQQQPQFDAFAQAMRQNAQSMDALTQQEQPGTVHNAVEDLRAAAKFCRGRGRRVLKRLLPPLQALYESLSDPQKKTADQVMTAPPAEISRRRPHRVKNASTGVAVIAAG